jgi:hypothetical protein
VKEKKKPIKKKFKSFTDMEKELANMDEVLQDLEVKIDAL